MRRPIITPDRKWFIYLLVDPRVTSGRAQDEVRYVGFSVNPSIRFDVHVEEATKIIRNTHKLNWIRSLLSDGLEPVVRIVDCGVGNLVWQSFETFWIRFYREEVGANLTNATDGGEGSLGAHVSESTRRKISDSKMGCPSYVRSDEHRQRMIAKLTGVKKSDSHIRSMSEVRKGKPPAICGWNKGLRQSIASNQKRSETAIRLFFKGLEQDLVNDIVRTRLRKHFGM